MNTFDLRVTFTGLCFFLNDNGKAMWVLMPATPHHPSGQEKRRNEHHVAKLMYDRAYATEGSTDFARDVVCVSLDRKELVLGGSAALSLHLPGEVAVLDLGHGPVDDALINSKNPPEAKLNARVKLEAGCICNYEPGIIWEVTIEGITGSTKQQRLTYRAEWVIRNINASSITLRLTDLDSGAYTDVGPLYPIGETVRLDIMHLPLSKFPANEVDITNAHGEHVKHYQALAKGAGPGVKVTPHSGQLFQTQCPPETHGAVRIRGAEPIECMFGGGFLP